jgi:hypothetical protein
VTLVLEIAGVVAAPRKGPTLASSPRLASNSDPFASRHDSTCSALEGIRGLAFGMSRDRAAGVIGRLRRRKPVRRTVVSGDCRERVDEPGERLKAVTTIGPEDAVCELWFLDAGLALIDCDLKAPRSREGHVETAWLLYQSLAKQYGQAHDLADRLATSGRLQASWTSDAAELTLSTRLGGRRSSIALVNRSRAYIEAINAQVKAVRERCEAEAAARERAKKEREEKRLERARSFEKDLRPPLERPQ